MNTPSHALIGLALIKKKDHENLFWPVLIGSWLPDVNMFLFYGYQKIIKTPESVIWNQKYYEPNWQNFFDITNSIPLIATALMFSCWHRSVRLIGLFAAMLLHCLLDLPLHNDDGHRHFWPLSDYRFESPVSYWDPDHYGLYAAPVEAVFALIAALAAYRFYKSKVKRWAIVLSILPYLVAVFAFLIFQFFN